jgi:hypothetical protein
MPPALILSQDQTLPNNNALHSFAILSYTKHSLLNLTQLSHYLMQEKSCIFITLEYSIAKKIYHSFFFMSTLLFSFTLFLHY